ncbi:DUF1971 domain-containing protein [Rhizobium sp. CG4]|uniref:DUF1971 domain-containing protein n=1 Tax=Rhizobium sp. CG4 TaxID=2726075 RepID=UPI0020340036|nr:DUF1971 domain-containing protein [Rhizobium sp. CG4]MCM2458170.1 DUF1971 domain-containing protein [Rhizobium sp. CG4]
MDKDLTEAKIKEVLTVFYAKVRIDPALSVPFSVVRDWDEHMVRLTDFWSSLMLTSGRYKGNPLSMHVIHSHLFRPDMFDRWLEIWAETTDDLLAPQVAQEMQAKAVRIAARFSFGLFGTSTTRNEDEAASVARPVPYKTTASFDEVSLPAALLRDHSLKAGSWGLIRVEEGSIQYHEGGISRVIEPDSPAIIPPISSHRLALTGPVKLKIEFYDRRPVQNA